MRPVCRKALRDLQLRGLQTIPDIGQVGCPDEDLFEEGRLGLVTEGELRDGVGEGQAGGEAADEVHAPGGVADVAFVADVGFQCVEAAFDEARAEFGVDGGVDVDDGVVFVSVVGFVCVGVVISVVADGFECSIG
mmetsp:Transcript_1421/g.1909  ORF Transcript_1421/g.1909 Transcript_1421/m.1909 type:complete len:135 (-) Transcript_1421:156-560(-)|eukprot:CAMPEP_0202454102 /NCGR_PEP_ID=MMETSP1360-20130828/11914_1 /ASSEMBLY_ACC=CAM_ASM_000848 /TAXON_ID=515479 /ORGANISM="Licmophora paradoxa, Strain CCMP2313" /LENGTH=134 /DNA_ID=CAMNT_0049073341 /DNA_START=316 /DNA_END=720 /DNA_ORIENTATION=+